MEIYVTRHGITPLNIARKVNGEIDESLALEGMAQARAAASLVPENIRFIYHSPLQRARHTAQLLNSNLKRPLIETPELTEVRMGSLAGFSWEEMPEGLELKRKHRTVTFDYGPYGGESTEEVIIRLSRLLKRVKDNHLNKEVLLVTHGGIIRTLHYLEQGNVVDDTERHINLVELNIVRILNSPLIR